jgi:hypothetical protein
MRILLIRGITIGIVCACACAGVAFWFRHVRLVEYARTQLYLVGKALAAYVAESGGQYPPDAPSLRELGVVRDAEPECVRVIAVDVDGYPSWDAHAPFPVQLDQFDIAWGGVPLDGQGLMVRSRAYPGALDDTARRISQELNRLAHDVQSRQN